jgi:hypothetical protein
MDAALQAAEPVWETQRDGPHHSPRMFNPFPIGCLPFGNANDKIRPANAVFVSVGCRSPVLPHGQEPSMIIGDAWIGPEARASEPVLNRAMDAVLGQVALATFADPHAALRATEATLPLSRGGRHALFEQFDLGPPLNGSRTRWRRGGRARRGAEENRQSLRGCCKPYSGRDDDPQGRQSRDGPPTRHGPLRARRRQPRMPMCLL